MKLRLQVNIQAQPKMVYQYLTDPNYLKKWMLDFEGYQAISGRRWRTGGKGKLLFGKDKSRLEVIEDILEAIPGEKFEAFLYHKNMDTLQSYRLTTLDDGNTRLTLEFDVKLRPAILNLFGRLFKRSFKNQQWQDLKRLKQVIENQ